MPRPNILWITTDQHRYDGMGCAGNQTLRTPNLDRLAREGVRFERAYTVSPFCAPSRAAMITGRYAGAHGVWHLGVPLPEREETLAAVLGRHGYRTGLIGKAHLGCIDQPWTGGTADARGSGHLPRAPEQQVESIHRRNGAPPDEVDRFWQEWHGPYYGFERADLVLHHGNAAVGGGHYDA